MAEQARKDFVMSRVFDVPRDLVWRCFTEVEHLKQWWGPKGVRIAKANVEFRVGGSFHYAMQPPSGDVMWGKMAYREITPQDRIVFINSFSDEAGGVTRHPMAPGWPLQMLSAFTFEECRAARRSSPSAGRRMKQHRKNRRFSTATSRTSA